MWNTEGIAEPQRVRLLVFTTLGLLLATQVLGHGVAENDQGFLARAEGVWAGPFMYLGAKHMVTGYDHLLYLAGVIFYLGKLVDVVKFVSLFAVGHSITLLFGVLAGVHVSPYFIDAIIGLSICYKALENLGSIRFVDPKVAVFGFGLGSEPWQRAVQLEQGRGQTCENLGHDVQLERGLTWVHDIGHIPFNLTGFRLAFGNAATLCST